MVERFDVYLVSLDLAPSKDAKNTRPCVVISPDEMNRNIQTIIIAPLSAASAKYPTRIEVDFLNNRRSIVLDQIRAVDRGRLVKKIGSIDKAVHKQTLEKLQEMFAE
jgi:mRNA interferase MazF